MVGYRVQGKCDRTCEKISRGSHCCKQSYCSFLVQMSKAAFDLAIIPSAKVGRRKGQLIPAGEPVRRNRVLADRRVTYSLQLLITGKNKVYFRRIISPFKIIVMYFCLPEHLKRQFVSTNFEKC